MTKEKIKLGLNIFIVTVLLGASLFLWFMIYKDSAKNNIASKKSDITDGCDQSLGNCNNKPENIPASSKSEEVVTNSPRGDESKSYQAGSESNITKNSSNIEIPSILPDKNAPQPVVSKSEVKKVETTQTAKVAGNADDGKEKETDDSITVETESDD